MNPQKFLILTAGQSNMSGRGTAGPDEIRAAARRQLLTGGNIHDEN